MRRPFDYIPMTSELGRQLAALGNEFIHDPQVAALMAGSAGSHYQLVADAKLRVRRSGRLELRRVYCCVQQRRPAPPRFRARTLQYYSATGSQSWHNFPEDPDLSTLAAFVDKSDAEVLSYVPLRRATLRQTDVAGDLIIKFKRHNRFEQAAQLQAQLHSQVLTQGNDFPLQVASLLHIDSRHHCFTQQALAGRNLATLLTPDNAAAWLHRVGAVHAALHRLPACDWPPEPEEDAKKPVNDCAWVALVAPEQGAELASCLALLNEEPARPADRWFCHGDFVCSQLLAQEGRWGVVDFDGGHCGDRHRDLAIFMASLGYDVPALAADLAADRLDGAALRQLRAAYLAGYNAHSETPVDPVRLNWQLARAELHYLALMVKKNRYHPQAFNIALANLAHTCRELES